ncbi:hypothetical protein [Cellulosilyticum sp. I15G10I2]|uniref:hypothetical protein n=1 Tax=Cellulosilyticum sp. I15G10I2 TaxID=1892843 RepID=UPI001495A05A|nr:hypothetical protein [Cellulosilyticum sp. I15G10I2]
MSKGNGMSTYTTEMLKEGSKQPNPESGIYPSNRHDTTKNAKHHLEGNGIITKGK